MNDVVVTASYAHKPVYAFVKRFADIVISLLFLIILSPVFLVVALIIKCSDGGNVIYKSKRIGLHGKEINVFKFRSMKMNADKLEDVLSEEELEQYKKEYKLTDDKRVTKIGKFLRKTSIDELPQLFNVLIGNMSLVGPRPVLYEETLLYGDQRDVLLSVKPGITGLWQASGRSNITYENGLRQQTELRYVAERSILFDLKIIFMTVGAVLKMDGAH